MFLFLFSQVSIGPDVPRGLHKNDKTRDEAASKRSKEKCGRKPFWGSITAFSLAVSWVELSINIYWPNLFAGQRENDWVWGSTVFFFRCWFIFWINVVDAIDSAPLPRISFFCTVNRSDHRLVYSDHHRRKMKCRGESLKRVEKT